MGVRARARGGGCDQIHTNNVVRQNLAYFAEVIWDEVSSSSFTNLFGSSYVEAVKFGTAAFLRDLNQNVININVQFIIHVASTSTFALTPQILC